MYLLYLISLDALVVLNVDLQLKLRVELNADDNADGQSVFGMHVDHARVSC